MIIRTQKHVIFAFSLFLAGSINAKTSEFAEDPYAAPAPQELVTQVERVAQEMDFTDVYEIAVPKKAGIQINPWNKFIGSGINPQTKQHFIVVNTDWFSNIPQEEQTFSLGRCFMHMKYGVTPFSIKIVWYLYALISILLALLVFLALGYTPLANQKAWIKIVMALAFAIACELAVMDPVHARLERYLQARHSNYIHELVVEKTKDRAAAIRALQYIDASIKNEYKNGEIPFAPFITTFATYAEQLKRAE